MLLSDVIVNPILAISVCIIVLSERCLFKDSIVQNIGIQECVTNLGYGSGQQTNIVVF